MSDSETVHADSATESNIRDPEYYREDGDCIILVQNVLFKVFSTASMSPLELSAKYETQLHRFLLTRDSPVFHDMFSLPHSSSLDELAGVQGMSDENPIVFHDDLKKVRALCWGLYAL